MRGYADGAPAQPPSPRSYPDIITTSLNAAVASLARLSRVARVKVALVISFKMSALLQDSSLVLILVRHVLRTGSAKVVYR